MNMKTWMNPELEELEIELTAAKGDGNHCEEHWPGNGHSGDCTPDCAHYSGDDGVGEEYDDPDGGTMS